MQRRFTVKRVLLTLCLSCCAALTSAEEMPSVGPLNGARLWDIEDRPAGFARFRDRPLVVNFWARWCGPCRTEIPELTRARARHKGKVEVLGLAIEDKPEDVRDFMKTYEMNYPVLLTKDQGIPLMIALGNAKAGLPYTLALDKRGRVVYKKLGGMNEADVEAAFAAALKP